MHKHPFYLLTCVLLFFVLCTGRALRDKFIQHYQFLRANPLYKDATIFYIFENNLGREHDHLNLIVEDTGIFSNCKVLQEHPNMIGFWTDDKKKLIMDDGLQQLVTFGRLRFAHNFISVNDDVTRVGDKAIEMLVKQIEDLKEYTTMRAGSIRRIVASILRDDLTVEEGKHDDLQRALSMLIYASTQLFTNKLPLNYSELVNMRRKRPIESEMLRSVNELVRNAKRHKDSQL